MKRHVTLTIDTEILNQFKKFVANVSADVEAYMGEKLAKVATNQGEAGPTVTRDQFEGMTREFIKMGRRVADEEAFLRKIRKFDLLYSVARQVGLDWQGLSNLHECKPKMRTAWTGSSALMREFLIYLDWCESRRILEKQLQDIDDGKVRIAEVDVTPKETVVLSQSIPT